MEKLRIAIYDRDVEYSRRLMNYLNDRYGKHMDVAVFTKKDSLLEESREHGFECIVTDDASYMEDTEVIRICEEETEDGFYRYSSARLLAERILERQKSDLSYGTGEGKMIAVYSPAGGIGKTAYALKKAEELDGIYFGMEDFCSLETKDYWMEQLLFLVREREEDICEQMQQHLQWLDGVRVLPSARCFLDYRYMKKADYEWLFEKLREERKQSVIFDIGVGSLTDFQILDLFDQVLLLTSEEGRRWQKMQVFLQLIHQMSPGIRSKITFIPEGNLG